MLGNSDCVAIDFTSVVVVVVASPKFVCVCATTGMIQSIIDKDYIGNDAGGGDAVDAVGR